MRIDHIGDYHIDNVCCQLCPHDAAHTEEHIHEKQDRNIQAELPDHCKLERNLPPIHRLHEMHHVKTQEHKGRGKAARLEELRPEPHCVLV